MVLQQKQTTVAYRCPECGAAVISLVGVFALTADMIRLKCPCGHSELEILYTKDKKVRLTVPCFACPTPHSYLISSSLFFEKELFTLPCAYSGLDICFIGHQKEVQDAIRKAEEELVDMLGDIEFEEYAKARGERRELTDPQVLDVVMYVVHELEDEGAIHCNCSEGEGDYTVEIEDDHVTVACEVCGAKAEVPTDSLSAARDFLNIDELNLK